MTLHTSRTIGTAYQPGVGLVHVEQLRPGSALMRLIPIQYHDHYSNSPLICHRSRVNFRRRTA